eukprot:625366-Amphidinium_carterae.1
MSTAKGRKDPRPKGQHKTPVGQKMPRARRGDARTQDPMGSKDAGPANRSHFTLALVARITQTGG